MPTDINQTLNRALRELEAERHRLERQIGALRTALGATNGAGVARVSVASRARRRRGTMTAAQRAEVGRRMKAYWAKRRAEKAAAAKKTTKAASALATSKPAAKRRAAKKVRAKKATRKSDGAA